MTIDHFDDQLRRLESQMDAADFLEEEGVSSAQLLGYLDQAGDVFLLIRQIIDTTELEHQERLQAIRNMVKLLGFLSERDEPDRFPAYVSYMGKAVAYGTAVLAGDETVDVVDV